MANPGGSFIPTTNIWDVNSIDNLDPALKELLVRMYQNIGNISNSMNTRDAGYYPLDEFVCGQVFFPNPSLSSTTSQAPVWRNTFRKVINFGALPNTATKSVAHGIPIDSSFTFTRIYGTTSDPVALMYHPLPYSTGVLANNIELWVDGTNVNITTGMDLTSYTITYIVLEYLKY